MRAQSSIRLLLLASLISLAGCECGDPSTGNTDGGNDAATQGDAGGMDSAPGGCGDGFLDRTSEACDDGNTTDGDGCSADCSSDETCGNGIRDEVTGELCDDGNTADGDTCRSDCLSDYRCGNGIVDTTADGATRDEVCDDGNTVNGDGCSATCESDESCGNGIVDTAAGEVCDDGNMEDGDDCSADCSVSLLCGNGTLDGAEECDDGNTDPGDGCDGSCRMERCGNGRIDAGEDCDDGNTDDNDGCTAACAFTCSADEDCADTDICDGAETCSDPGTATSTCADPSAPAPDGTACGTGLICVSGGCVASACGDGVVGAGEQCDDGNIADGDGCDNDCTFTCSADADCSDSNPCTGMETCSSPGTGSSACVAGTPLGEGASCGTGMICRSGVCAAAGCGDGVVTAPEDCDDGNTTSGDGCDNDCTWTCTGAGDCSDGNACNGSETCTAPSSLASRCNAGTPPAAGTSCGTGLICNGGSCVAARCGDGIVTSPEQCDDSNTANGDGCDNDCTWTCAGAADCADTNACNGSETCTMPGTLMSRCMAGTPLADGAVCDADMMAGTRDICRSGVCAASRCGDSFVDTGATPPEQCDDGNTTPGDGCSATCQTETVGPTAFRVTSLDLISPRIVYNVPLRGCRDLTETPTDIPFSGPFSVNMALQDEIDSYGLNIVSLFRPLAISSATSPLDVHFDAACTAGTPRDSCGPDATPDIVMTTANNMTTGTCFTPVVADVNTRAGTPAAYSPTVNTVGGPCFVTDETNLSVTFEVSGSPLVVPLQRARIAATYSGTPTDRLVTGVVTGFVTDRVAADTTITLDFVGTVRLYELLQAGNRSTTNTAGATVNDTTCNLGGGAMEDDGDTITSGGSTVRGFWFFLNFDGEVVNWSGT